MYCRPECFNTSPMLQDPVFVQFVATTWSNRVGLALTVLLTLEWDVAALHVQARCGILS